jgi:hypothetical protein
LEEVKKNLYIFGGGGEFGKNPIEKQILEYIYIIKIS